MKGIVIGLALVTAVALSAEKASSQVSQAQRARSFDVHEATVADIQRALQSKQVTTVGVVEQYLRRIKAYNGACVTEPQGLLGPDRSTRSPR